MKVDKSTNTIQRNNTCYSKKEKQYFFAASPNDLQGIKDWFNKKINKGYQPNGFSVNDLTVEELNSKILVKIKQGLNKTLKLIDKAQDVEALKKSKDEIEAECAALKAMIHARRDPTAAWIGTSKVVFLPLVLLFWQGIEKIFRAQEHNTSSQVRMWFKSVIAIGLTIVRLIHALDYLLIKKECTKGWAECGKFVLEACSTALPLLHKVDSIGDDWELFLEACAWLIDLGIEYFDITTEEQSIVLADIQDAYYLLGLQPNDENFLYYAESKNLDEVNNKIKEWYKLLQKAENKNKKSSRTKNLSEDKLIQGCHNAFFMIQAHNSNYNIEVKTVLNILEKLRGNFDTETKEISLKNGQYKDALSIFEFNKSYNKITKKIFDARYAVIIKHISNSPTIANKIDELKLNKENATKLFNELKDIIYEFEDIDNYGKKKWQAPKENQANGWLQKIINFFYRQNNSQQQGQQPPNQQQQGQQPSNQQQQDQNNSSSNTETNNANEQNGGQQ